MPRDLSLSLSHSLTTHVADSVPRPNLYPISPLSPSLCKTESKRQKGKKAIDSTILIHCPILLSINQSINQGRSIIEFGLSSQIIIASITAIHPLPPRPLSLPPPPQPGCNDKDQPIINRNSIQRIDSSIHPSNNPITTVLLCLLSLSRRNVNLLPAI